VGEYLCPTRVHVAVGVGAGVPERHLDASADQRVTTVEELTSILSKTWTECPADRPPFGYVDRERRGDWRPALLSSSRARCLGIWENGAVLVVRRRGVLTLATAWR
jgi:hypothetical protein